MRTNYNNFAQTTITAPNSVITTFTGDDGSDFPPSNFYATIQQRVGAEIIKEEIVSVTTRTWESFIVVRGQDGTLAQDFTTWGGTIYLSINTVAGHFNDLRDETEALDDRITTNESDIATNSDDIETLEWFTTVLDADLITLENSAVLKTGDQTIAWVKTFSSSPIVPTPTTDTQATSKGYVDWLVWRKANVVLQTFTFNDIALSDVTVPHWLWYAPTYIKVEVWWMENPAFIWWFAWYDGTSWKQYVWRPENNSYTSTALILWQEPWDSWAWSIVSVDATNITLSYSFFWSYSLVTKECLFTFI